MINDKEVDPIKYRVPGSCPICGHELTVSGLSCPQCRTHIEGEFQSCKFCQLPADQVEFVEVFIKCRGNIKEVEKELGISYPTVRSRLETVIQALGYRVERSDRNEQLGLRQEILDALDKGDITYQEAVEQLKKAGK